MAPLAGGVPGVNPVAAISGMPSVYSVLVWNIACCTRGGLLRPYRAHEAEAKLAQAKPNFLGATIRKKLRSFQATKVTRTESTHNKW